MGSSGRADKNTRIGFLKTAVRTATLGRPNGTRATSLSPFFWRGAFGRGSKLELDEFLGFLHLQHVSGQLMSPSGQALFQFQFCTLNSILFTNISQYLKLTNSPFGNFGNKICLPQQTPHFCHKLTKGFKFPETLNKHQGICGTKKINKIHDHI